MSASTATSATAPFVSLRDVTLAPVAGAWGLLKRCFSFGRKRQSAPITPRRNSGEPAAVADAQNDGWDEISLSVAERLWGDGCLGPCNGDYILGMAHLIGLDETRSMLQVGAQMGGAGRFAAAETGVWVTGYEQDTELVERAGVRAQMAAMTKKAPVKRYDPAKPKFKANSFNAAMACDGLLHVADKKVVIDAMCDALRIDGHLVLTECVLPNAVADGSGPSDTIRHWLRLEPETPHFWTAKAIYDVLDSLPLEIRIAEDITAKYRTMVLGGWLKLLSGLTKAELTVELAPAVLAACEYWLYRVAALDSGALRVYRFHAIKQAPERAAVDLG